MQSETFFHVHSRSAKLLPLWVLLAAWEVGVLLRPDLRFFLASPVDVALALRDAGLSGELLTHTAVTLGETLAGLAIGTTSGVLLGLSLWYWPLAAHMIRPYVMAAGAVPVFALAPLMILWFGIGIAAKIMVAVIATIFVAMAQAYDGASQVRTQHLRLIHMLGGTRWQAFRKVVVPSALQWVMQAMRLNVGFALTGAFIGEFIASDRGLGYFIVRAASLYDMPRVLAGCVVLMLLSLLLSALVGRIEARLPGFRPGRHAS
jgi:NitT/TauT family transport system permease protein